MIKTYWLNSSGAHSTGGAELIEQWREVSDSTIWVDLEYSDLDNKAIVDLLGLFNCSSLVVSDVMRKRHPPKIELFDHQIFILYRGITEVIDPLEYQHQQIGFFIGENFLLTVHPSESSGVRKVLASNELSKLLQHPMRLALKIMHLSSETYLNNLLEFEEELGLQEDALQKGQGEDYLAALATYRIKLLRLRRLFNYHQQMFAELSQLDPGDTNMSLAPYEHHIIDVFERFERLYSLSTLYYDICSDMVEAYISITSHQQNVSMRILTVVTSIFVPLSFLAGIYGMNFERIPELRHPNGYFILLGIMGALSLTLLTIFKKKKWF